MRKPIFNQFPTHGAGIQGRGRTQEVLGGGDRRFYYYQIQYPTGIKQIPGFNPPWQIFPNPYSMGGGRKKPI